MKLKLFACLGLLFLVTSLALAQQNPSRAPQRDAANSSGSLVDWPQFNFDPGLTGYNPYESTLNPTNVGSVTRRWIFAPSGRLCSQPAVANGILYFGTDLGYVYALNADTGALIWMYVTQNFPVQSPAVANGIVYVPAGDLYALDANTGALLWHVANAGQSSPTVLNNVLYTSDGSDFMALNAETGARIWGFSSGSVATASPAVANGMAYVTSWDGGVYGLNAGTGMVVWHRHFGVSPTPRATPYRTAGGLSVANATVYIAIADPMSQQSGFNIYALDGGSGATIWKSPSVGNITFTSTPAVANGRVFVGAKAYAYALNASTGATVWQAALFNGGDAISPIVANGVVYVESWSVRGAGFDYFAIDALDAGTGQSLWEHVSGVDQPERWPTPAVLNGVIYGTANDQNIATPDVGAFGLANQ